MNPHIAYICDAVRTPIGRYNGSLAHIRTDDLAALPIKALMLRHPDVNWSQVDDVLLGCANQSGEDNRNVARMAGLLAGLPQEVAGTSINRLCGSGMDAVGTAARAIAAGEAALMIAGGVESMTRAPWVMPKADGAFARNPAIYDTTIGWRMVNPIMHSMYGTDSMPETADHLAHEHHISRDDQDAFALASQHKWAAAQQAQRFADEIIPVNIVGKRGEVSVFAADEHPRPETTLEQLNRLKPINGQGQTVTAGNASGVNDGACALLLANREAIQTHQLTAKAKVLGMAVAGVAPRIMGIGPVPAIHTLLARLNLSLNDMDVIEINEAFAAQSLAVTRQLGLADNDPRINPNGGAIAMGHPLGMSGARLITTAVHELQRRKQRYALCSMCIGVGQGIAMIIERV